MEKERAKGSVARFAYGGVHRSAGFTPMFVAAAVSVIVLLSVLGWRISQMGAVAPLAITSTNALSTGGGGADAEPQNTASLASITNNGAGSANDISQIGANVMSTISSDYAGLQQFGVYSSSTADAVAKSALSLMQTNVPYTTFVPNNIKTTADTSYARMLAYRADLRTSLAPLLKNTTAEYAVFGSYVETGDKTYLSQLQTAAQNYFDAASSTAQLIVPQDAVQYQVGILNAMNEFGATLDAMVAHADDPFASAALLQSYNQAESDMVTSFNALATYYKSKQQ